MTENFSEVSPDISTYPVVIAIARDFGAEGHEIGKMLSVELGIPLYDNEVLVRAAMRAGVTTDQIAAYDESLAAEVAAFLPDRVDARSVADKLFKQMEGVIRDLGSSESCIIEGRLSDYILRDNPNLITVLVTAPLEARIEIVRSKRDISEKKARKLVKRMQRAREMFYKRYSAGKWTLHAGKDVVVPRSLWSPGLRRHSCRSLQDEACRCRARSCGARRLRCSRGCACGGVGRGTCSLEAGSLRTYFSLWTRELSLFIELEVDSRPERHPGRLFSCLWCGCQEELPRGVH